MTEDMKVAEETVQPVSEITDVRVVAEPHHWVTRGCRGYEEEAKALESWARDFNDFVRDHRSQDQANLSVERVTAELCSGCGSVWKPGDIDGVTCCRVCGLRVQEAPNE